MLWWGKIGRSQSPENDCDLCHTDRLVKFERKGEKELLEKLWVQKIDI